MKDSILIELAVRWENDSKIESVLDGSESEKLNRALEEMHQECKRECADALRTLVSLLGTDDNR